MVAVTVKQQIDASPERVFAAATDFANAAERVEGIKKMEVLTDGPVGVGTRFRETRIMFKKEATEEMEVTVFEPSRRYVVEAQSCGCHYVSTFTFEPLDGGTLVTMVFDGKPLTFVSKVMSVIFRPMMKMAAKMCAKDLADLKRQLEAAPVA